MIVVPPRMCLVTSTFVDDLAKDLRVALPGYRFQVVPDYVGRQSHEFFVEADGVVPDAAIERLKTVLGRYGDITPSTGNERPCSAVKSSGERLEPR